MGTAVSLINNFSVTLRHALHIIVMAKNSYHSLNDSNVWNVPQGKHGHHSAQHPHHTSDFFNFVEAHLLPDFKRAHDEAKIVCNSKAYMDKLLDG